MKRFYSQVSVTPDMGILLDARPVKTPAKVTLTLPNAALAEAVADEWRAQGDDINPFSMPLTKADIATREDTPRMIPSIVSRDLNL